MSFEAYRKSSAAAENPIQTEYRIFAEITRELEAAAFGKDAAKQIKAVYRNSQLWLTLQADLVSDENHMDIELKAGLISLAIWVGKYTSPALKIGADLTPLIAVNKQIMEGLMSSYRNAKVMASNAAIQNTDASLTA
jgi:flagellar biosynthesis activator protein FlaF